MSTRQGPRNRPTSRGEARSTTQARRHAAIGLSRELALDHELRLVQSYMTEARDVDDRWLEDSGLEEAWTDELAPELGLDDDDDEASDDDEPEAETERWWLAGGVDLPEPAFGLALAGDRVRVTSLLDESELDRLYPGTVEFVAVAMHELEAVLNEEARLPLLRRRLARGQDRARLVGVSELAERVLQHYDVGDGDWWSLFLSLRSGLSALINQEWIALPDGRCERLSWFFPPKRGSDVAEDQAILGAARRALALRPLLGNVTELAEALLEDNDPGLLAWLARLRGRQRTNSIAKRLGRIFATYADDILDGAAEAGGIEQEPLAPFVRQVIVNEQRSRRWRSRPGQ